MAWPESIPTLGWTSNQAASPWHPGAPGCPQHLQGSFQVGQLHTLPGDLLLGHRVQGFRRPLVEPGKGEPRWTVARVVVLSHGFLMVNLGSFTNGFRMFSWFTDSLVVYQMSWTRVDIFQAFVGTQRLSACNHAQVKLARTNVRVHQVFHWSLPSMQGQKQCTLIINNQTIKLLAVIINDGQRCWKTRFIGNHLSNLW